MVFLPTFLSSIHLFFLSSFLYTVSKSFTVQMSVIQTCDFFFRPSSSLSFLYVFLPSFLHQTIPLSVCYISFRLFHIHYFWLSSHTKNLFWGLSGSTFPFCRGLLGAGNAYYRNFRSKVLGIVLGCRKTSRSFYICKYITCVYATCILITYFLYGSIMEHG